MDRKRDNIYIYLWEEFNTVYIGRTINPKGRHYQHKHRKSEATYKFSSEHHVEHPKMIIIENDLTIEEGVEREKYWINEYRENSPYNVLNKREGGEVGRILMLTEEERKERKITWYNLHKEELNAKSRKYKNAHKDKIKEYRKEWYDSHKEEEKQYQRKYYDEHKEELRGTRKQYRKEK